MRELRSIFDRYRQNKQTIIVCDREIAMRRLEMMPTKTSRVTFEPPYHDNKNKTEELIIKFEEDDTIGYWESVKYAAECDINTVDSLINMLDDETATIFSLKYKEGIDVPSIAIKFGYSRGNVYRIIDQTFKRLEPLYRLYNPTGHFRMYKN